MHFRVRSSFCLLCYLPDFTDVKDVSRVQSWASLLSGCSSSTSS
jgi:hypothetical protein